MSTTQTSTAVVTGASAGFGAAITWRLVAGGWRVHALARRAERLDELRRELGDQVTPLTLDVTDREAVEAAFGDGGPLGGDIDLVVNNAGLAIGTEPAQDGDPAEWDTMIATNCTGVLNVTHAALPAMIRRGTGHLVNIGSTAGVYPYPGGNVYGATKAFVAHLGANLRTDLHGTGIRVSTIEPGMSEGTEFSNVRYRGNDRSAAEVYQGVDALTSADVAEAVWWAVSAPARVNVNRIEMMATAQSPAGLRVHRDDAPDGA